MDVLKSTRHAKITGDFGEAAVLFYLSLSGYECARVDHTGMDLIARSARLPQPFGISVKARSRSPGTEQTALKVAAWPMSKSRVSDYAKDPAIMSIEWQRVASRWSL